VAANSFVRRVRAVVVLDLAGGTIAVAVGAAPASAGLGLACPSLTSTPFSAWSDYPQKPSPAIGMLGGVLPLLTSGVAFRFTAVGGDAAIDDVYLDPMKSS
jgi:hypothetical protein